MPSYSGVWNLVSQYQAVGAGNWPYPPVGFLLKFSNVLATNNIQAESSPIDKSTGISYCTFNYLSGGFYGIRIAAVTSVGTVKWSKSYSVTSSDLYATDSSQNGTHIFIAARGSGSAVVLKISKTDGTLVDSKQISSSSYNVGISVDAANSRFYFQYADGSAHQVGCFSTETFAAVWSPLAVTYGGSYPTPVAIRNVSYNSANGIAYGFFNRNNSSGSPQEPYVIALNSTGVSFVQNLSPGLARNFYSATFDSSNNIITSGDGYIASFNSTASTVNWGRSYSYYRGMSENAFSNGNVYPWGSQGKFLKFDSTGPSVSWSRYLQTGPTASDFETYVSGAVEYQNYVLYCFYENSFATGNNAYVMSYPLSGSYTGSINSSAQITTNTTTLSTSTPSPSSVTPTTSASGFTFSNYTVTTSAWSPTTTLTVFA